MKRWELFRVFFNAKRRDVARPLFAFCLAIAPCFALLDIARAEVVRVEVRQRQPFAEGMAFGHTGPYEAIRGRLHLEVDPNDPANGRIADLKLAPENERGRVEFWSDFFLLTPADPLRGNRRILYDVNNRGNLLALWTFNNGERTNNPLVAMDRWVGENREPPASRYPRIDDGTLVPVDEFRRSFPAIPSVDTPTACYAPLRLDLGSRWDEQGIADVVPAKIGKPYPTLVPQVDADGNELAGIQLPDVAVPLGTFTGWNLRAAEHGGEGMLAGLDGSYLPFALNAAERQKVSDPRPSVLQRYPMRGNYLEKYMDATLRLQADGFLLPEDAVALMPIAAGRGGAETGSLGEWRMEPITRSLPVSNKHLVTSSNRANDCWQ